MKDSTSSKFHPSYSDADADLVLLSKDGVRFRAHSSILKLASGVFRRMLRVPRAESEGPKDAILMEETAEIIGALLDAVYPSYFERHTSTLATITNLAEPLARAAAKYDMPGVTSAIKLLLYSNSDRSGIFNPPCSSLKKFRLACTLGWEREAKIASAETLHFTTIELDADPELMQMSGNDVASIFRLRRARRDYLVQALHHPCYIQPDTHANKVRALRVEKNKLFTFKTFMPRMFESPQWKAFVFHVSELVEQFPDGRSFRTSSFFNSPTFEAALGICYSPNGDVKGCERVYCDLDVVFPMNKQEVVDEFLRILDRLPNTI